MRKQFKNALFKSKVDSGTFFKRKCLREEIRAKYGANFSMSQNYFSQTIKN